MNKKLISPNRVPCSLLFTLCSLLFALCFLFASCKEPVDDNPYRNPNDGTSRGIAFSHNSGLYSRQFSLTLTAPPESDIYFSIDGSIPSPEKVGNGFVFKYTSPITVQNRNGAANILATEENTTLMHMDPNDERGYAPAIYIPTKDQVPKATVIRAIAVDAGGKKGSVLTKTYFIGNNLANYANNRVISIVTDPYNLLDEDYGILVRGNPENRWEPPAPLYNFLRRGMEWEREAFFELFEGNENSRSVSLSTGIGIRVRGGWSRASAQKSFNIYFREEYGINNLRNYNLIPGAVKADGTPVERYKSFMLRNGGNEGEYTKFYDVFIQDLLGDRSFSAQAGVPCVVYLNGEYWGPYNIQERYSDNHAEYKYGVRRENVLSYDNWEADDGDQGEVNWRFWEMMGMREKDMSIKENYDAFCELFDIENFVDYWAAQIYIYNQDWPQNNFRAWRTRAKEPGNPYGDQKWRWQMFDTDMSLGIYNGGHLTGDSDVDTFARILRDSKDAVYSELFKALLKNADFCRQFVNTMMDLYNKNFHPNNYMPKLNNYAVIYKPLMEGYFVRWGKPWETVYQNKVDDAKRYLNDMRDAMVYNYLPTYFGGYPDIANIGISGSNLYSVTLSTTGVSGASVKINTITPSLASGSWTGKYYSGNPVTVTASAPSGGYEFDGWAVTGGSAVSPSNRTTAVNFTGNVQITAKYRLKDSAAVPVTEITLNNTAINIKTGAAFNLSSTVVPDNATYKTVFWDSDNYNIANVDNNGKVTAVSGGTAVITASTVEGIKAICQVTVTPFVTGINFDISSQNLFIGDTKKLTVVFSPSDPPNEQTTWSSSNSSVVKVSNDGTITAVASGSAAITVTAVDGNKTAVCTVNIKAVEYATVLLDLAAKLQTLTPSVIDTRDKFNAAFSGIPVSRGGEVGTEVIYSIIKEDGVNKLQVNDFALGAPGLDIPDTIVFMEGDRIDVKGTYLKGPSNGIYVNRDCWGYDPLQNWNQWLSPGDVFQKTFILTADDADTINTNAKVQWKNAIKIKSGGIEPWNGLRPDLYPDGIGSYTIEQFKIYRY